MPHVAKFEDRFATICTRKYFRLSPLKDEQTSRFLCTIYTEKLELDFLYLWGVYKKQAMDELDLLTLQNLESVAIKSGEVLNARFNITLLICDSHSILNGVLPAESETYRKGIANYAVNKAWTVNLLSQHNIPPLKDFDAQAAFLSLPDSAQRELLRCGKKYSSQKEKIQGIYDYLTARIQEKEYLANYYRNHVHMTAANPATRLIQPDMPTFWIWTSGKNKTHKPWFKE